MFQELEEDYAGNLVGHHQIALAAYRTWEEGKGTGDPVIDWELARRGLKLRPCPTEAEIRQAAWILHIYGPKEGNPSAQENWHRAEESLVQKLREEWKAKGAKFRRLRSGIVIAS